MAEMTPEVELKVRVPGPVWRATAEALFMEEPAAEGEVGVFRNTVAPKERVADRVTSGGDRVGDSVSGPDAEKFTKDPGV